MPIANLEELSKGESEQAGFAPPGDGATDRGAFSFQFSGVTVTALHAHEGFVAFVAEAGRMPDAASLAGWLSLMDANTFMMDVDSPRFGRNPFSGEAVQQWMFPLDAVSVTDVYDRLMRMVALTLAWRIDPLLATQHSSADAWDAPSSVVLPAEHPVAVDSTTSFRELHKNVGDALGGPGGTMAQGVGDERFEIHLHGSSLHATIGHSPCARPGYSFIAVHLGTPSKAFVPDRAKGVLDANFALLKNPVATTFCRDPWTGEFMLMYAHTLTDPCAEVFLERLVRVGAIARAWQKANEVDKENE